MKRILIAIIAVSLLFATGVMQIQHDPQEHMVLDDPVSENFHVKTDLEHFLEGIKGMGYSIEVDQRVVTLKVKLGMEDGSFWGALVGEEIMPGMILADLAVVQACADHVHVIMYLIPLGQEIPEQPKQMPPPHNAEGIREKVLRGGQWA